MQITATELAKAQAIIRQRAEEGANIIFPPDDVLAEEDIDQVDIVRWLRRCSVERAYIDDGKLVYELLGQVDGTEMGGWVAMLHIGPQQEITVLNIRRVWKNNRGW